MIVNDDPADREKILSPCVSICALDEQDVCIGCGRTSDEIAAWRSADHTRKLAILQAVATRDADRSGA
ncbi:MAG: DUF1289 domain-containing protein [Pseudomonadota bacterium]